MTKNISIIGGGLAGSEAAWQLAQRDIQVHLFEMRPYKMTPAHKTENFAELVCSNSLRGASLENAVGLLKQELIMVKTLVMEAALASQIPAGGALAVDREGFANYISEKIEEHPNISISREEITSIPSERPVVIATGPLTSIALSQELEKITGQKHLHFYDAAAPIVDASSIDYEKIFRASRYGKGGDDYINCPLNKEEYKQFWQALLEAEQYQPHAFEKEMLFEGCMPVESLAARGFNTLCFGPLKPVGLINPRNNEQPFAVVQLRQDNREGTLYNMVGFQTKLKWPEQKRVFRLIPGMEKAEFFRFGSMHRNTFVNAPLVLNEALELSNALGVFLAGQITGVEGYVESTAMGFAAAINAFQYINDNNHLDWPPETAIGALLNYLQTANPDTFQPMNINFGLLPTLSGSINKKEKKKYFSKRALEFLAAFIEKNGKLLA